VEAEEKEYTKCLNILNERVEDLRQSMEESGLKRQRLKTSDYNLDYLTEYKNNEHVFIGYRASHKLYIEFPLDKELLNKVLNLVAQGNSKAKVNLDFSVRNKDAIREKALKQAVKVAQENAQLLATAAGVKLGKLIEIEHDPLFVRIFGQKANLNILNAPSLPGVESINADINPGDVNAGAHVTLVYEIED